MKDKIKLILDEQERLGLFRTTPRIKELIINDLAKLFNEETSKLIEEILLPTKENFNEF